MRDLTEAERDVLIEASHPSRPDRESLLVAVVERILAERIVQARREGAAEAWDAGWCAGVSRFTQQHLPATENPYRNVAAATYICRHGKYRSEHDCDDHRDRAAALRADA